MEGKRSKGVQRKGDCWRFRPEHRLFFRTENILLLKENQIPLYLRLVVYLWQRHRRERHSSWKRNKALYRKIRNEKHQEYQMINLCLCCSPSLPLTKTRSPSYFPHNPLQIVRGSKQETENNKTSVFMVRHIAGMIWQPKLVASARHDPLLFIFIIPTKSQINHFHPCCWQIRVGLQQVRNWAD